MVINYDCVVAGGGPAGAFAARELTRTGCKVLIVDPAMGSRRLEGLSDRVARLLESRGLSATMATASEPGHRQVDWAGLQSSANGERLVRRPAFDQALRCAAVEAGADLIEARLGRIEKGAPDQDVIVTLTNGNSVCSRLVIDARGRQAPSSRRLKGPQTLAISGLVEGTPKRSGTRVVSSPEGWMWQAGLPGFGCWLQICVEADSLVGGGQAALQDRLKGFLTQPQLRSQFGTLDLRSSLLARPAGLVLSAPELTLPVIPVGDAAVAIDPLSGHGLFWALSSALAAVPMVLTILENPERGAPLAARFYRARVVETFWRQARIGRDFYALEQDLAGHAFWDRRSKWPDTRPAHQVPDGSRLETRVVVENNRLVERDVLITPQDPGGVAFIAGLPVADLLNTSEGDITPKPVTGTPSPALQVAYPWLRSRGLIRGGTSQSNQQSTRTRETA